MTTINGVLFDLDGTMLDTADDLLLAFNRLRSELKLPAIDKTAFSPLISYGSKAMVKEGLGISEEASEFNPLRERFLALYEDQIAHHTRYFPNMEIVLQALDHANIPWGIVTNKLSKHTHQLLQSLRIEHRPHAIVCGDTLEKAKPHPDTILHALSQMQIDPTHCLYVGDALTDALASKAAGTQTVVALYGYIQAHENPLTWPAQHYINDPIELMPLL